jgi:sulfotransferase family protein
VSGQDRAPEDLIDRARASTGLEDLGSEHFRDLLSAWCDDLEDPRLSAGGRESLGKLAQRNLQTRLQVHETLRQFPEIAEVRLPRIVRIVGFPRSGTTLLHQLMAAVPGRRALLRWELVAPVPPPDAATYACDPRIERVGRPLEALRGSELERMHWVEATDPEECTWGFIDLSGLLGRGCVGMMPQWGGLVYDDRSHVQTYAEYRRLVQMLLWKNPLGPDEVLILKSPTDSDRIAEFLDVFPEAVTVMVHRDPFRTLTSTYRLQHVIAGPYLAEGTSLDDEEVTERGISIQAKQADAMVDLARSKSDRVANVRYADLMADPVAAVTELSEQLRLPGHGSSTREHVVGFLERQRTSRAAPPADYGSAGPSSQSVYSHPMLAHYMATFDVEPEHVRVTSPRVPA